MAETQPIHTRLWHEEPEPDNPFATRTARCRGYDVFGEMVGRARWVEMLWLLFREERPAPAAGALLEALAVGLANPGPRDASVHAAMCGGIGGTTAAATLMAALAAGAGRCGGAREVFDAMTAWQACGMDIEAWSGRRNPPAEDMDVWPAAEHVPGFDPHGKGTPGSVRQFLDALAAIGAGPRLPWLAAHRDEIEQAVGLPLALTGVAAAAFADLGLEPAEGEILFLLLRLPGAAAHALEQRGYGYKRFPFPDIVLEDDPMGNAP